MNVPLARCLLSCALALPAGAQVPATPLPSAEEIVITFEEIPPAAEESAAGVQQPSGASSAKVSSARLEKLKKLEYDRRPSAILAAWSTPPEPPAEASAGEAAASENPTSDAALPDGESKVSEEPAEGDEAKAPADESAAPESEGREASEAEPDPEAAKKAKAARDTAAKAAEKAAKEAEKAAQAEAIEAECARLRRDVTLGDWQAVADYLSGLSEAEREAAYAQLLASLQRGPKQQPNVPQQGRPYLEVNQFAPADVLGLAAAAPDKLSKPNLTLLGQILAQALRAGHQLESFLAQVSPRLDEAGFALDRRKLALVLVGADQPGFLGEYLPSADEAVAGNDREGLNLLSRFFLARYGEEAKTTWLEQAWKVTQAVLAVGEVEREQETEALQRAVDIAPKVAAELGQAWLDESFTQRPERGMQILAAIGTSASQGLSSKPLEAGARLKLLELQTTATRALLAAAPELSQRWGGELSLLAANWLREAQFSYQFDSSTTLGPRMQRDAFGNTFYVEWGQQQMRGNAPAAIPTAEILEIRPDDAWLTHVDRTLAPRVRMVLAQLLLKVGEEARAFPYIEAVAAESPRAAKALVDEFLQVWAKNHNPNEARNRTSQYVYFFGFEERAGAIPLTRSKQERNLAELGEWVARLRALPVEVDESRIARAFQAAHSTAEVYRLESIERIFGPLQALDPSTLAQLLEAMRVNLVGVWRDPALQEDKKTRRRKKDIEAEVLRGYELAHTTLARAAEDHPWSWELALEQAALDHDENNYRHELGDDPDFSARRAAAFEGFRRAAELYADGVEDLEQGKESTRVWELWFYAALGACDLRAIDPKMPLAAAEIDAIRDSLAGLPGERAKRHADAFASQLFARMSNANPAVKFRYVREGLAIVGDNKLAREAREVYDYYADLVTEIQLRATIDGSDRVGHEQPFGLRVDIRHTKEIERESGGFSKYLQNQNAQQFSFNYGRPVEDYRDKFEEAAREALQEHFEVLSVTFNTPAASSRADAPYGWRVTPYAYFLLKARGPQVDRVPPLRLDLDFLDTSGYAVLPVESSPLPIDAREAAGAERPFGQLTLTRTLDERQAKDGKLVLEVKARALGLVPPLERLLEPVPEGFELAETNDLGLSVVEFDPEADAIRSERTWTLGLRAPAGRPQPPSTFTFASPRVELAGDEHFRYVDADLVSVGPTVELEQHYGEPDRGWLWWLPLGALLAVGAVLGLRRLARPGPERASRFQVPDPLTPFTVLGLLRDIERNDGLVPEQRSALASEIHSIERHFFVDEQGPTPDLRRIAETWSGRAS